MSDITETRTSNYQRIIEKVLVSKPWLLPFIVYLSRNPMGAPSTIARVLGVKSGIVKRALWWLSKAGIVEIRREGGKQYYQAREEALEALEEITRRVRYHNRNYVLELANEYLLVRVRKNRILPYTIPSEIIDKVKRVLREAPNQEFTINDLALSINTSTRLLVQALRTLRILDVVEKSGSGYVLRPEK